MNIRLTASHLIIAISIGFIITSLSGILKLVLLPYVAYLLYLKRAECLPALIVLLGYGTILTVAAGLICVPIVISNRHKLMSNRARQFFYILLLMVPIFILITVIRVLNGVDLTSALIMNDYYIAFWFLLYGWVTHDQFRNKSVYSLVFLGLLLALISPLIRDYQPFSSLTRNASYFYLFGILLIINNWLYRKIAKKYALYFLILSVAFISGFSFKFTFLFGLLIGFLSLRSWQKQNNVAGISRYFKEKIFSRVLFFMPALFLAITIWLTPNYAQKYKNVEVDYSLNKSLVDQILYKTFVDRGLIWTGVIKGIRSNTEVLPPTKEWKIGYQALNGKELEVDFESHNLILGLIRSSGYLCGILLIYVYMQTMVSLYRTRAQLVGTQRILAVSLLGLGIAVFITGQYTLQLNASFFFMAATGGLIGCSESIETNNKKWIRS